MTEGRKASAVQIVVTGVAALLGAAAPIVVGYAWLDDRFDSQERQIDRLSSDRWRGRDQQSWAAQLQASNPSVRVPPVILVEGQ